MRASYQKMLPALSTEIMTFSGLVSRISTRSLGKESLMEVVTTGIVIKKMISNTNITSTRGVVLIVDMTASSPSSLEPTFMDIVSDAQAFFTEPRTTACKSLLKARTSSMTALLRRTSQL